MAARTIWPARTRPIPPDRFFHWRCCCAKVSGWIKPPPSSKNPSPKSGARAGARPISPKPAAKFSGPEPWPTRSRGKFFARRKQNCRMKPALLLIDLQNDYLAASGLQPTADILISRAAALLDTCRKRQIPVVHIWTTIHRDNDRRLPHWKEKNRWQCVAGTDGHKTPESLRPLKRETVIHKAGFNAFADSELDEALKKSNCDAIILAGLHSHACVRIAATESLER